MQGEWLQRGEEHRVRHTPACTHTHMRTHTHTHTHTCTLPGKNSLQKTTTTDCNTRRVDTWKNKKREWEIEMLLLMFRGDCFPWMNSKRPLVRVREQLCSVPLQTPLETLDGKTIIDSATHPVCCRGGNEEGSGGGVDACVCVNTFNCGATSLDSFFGPYFQLPRSRLPLPPVTLTNPSIASLKFAVKLDVIWCCDNPLILIAVVWTH